MDPNQPFDGRSSTHLWGLSPQEASDEDLLARFRATNSVSFPDGDFFKGPDHLEWLTRLTDLVKTKKYTDAIEAHKILLLCCEICAQGKLPTTTVQSDLYTALESKEDKIWSHMMIDLLMDTAAYAGEHEDFQAVGSCMSSR